MDTSRRRTTLAALALGLGLAATAAPTAAAEALGAELFAGYSLARIADANRHGADLAFAHHLAGPFSAFLDASAHWGSQGGLTVSDLTLMAGPGLRLGRRGGSAFFIRVLAGVVRDRASIGIEDVDISETSHGFGVLAGGGVDIAVAKRLAVRVQGDYLWHQVDVGGQAGGWRVASGVVWRPGLAR